MDRYRCWHHGIELHRVEVSPWDMFSYYFCVMGCRGALWQINQLGHKTHSHTHITHTR